jgi:hypothetical protein
MVVYIDVEKKKVLDKCIILFLELNKLLDKSVSKEERLYIKSRIPNNLYIFFLFFYVFVLWCDGFLKVNISFFGFLLNKLRIHRRFFVELLKNRKPSSTRRKRKSNKKRKQSSVLVQKRITSLKESSLDSDLKSVRIKNLKKKKRRSNNRKKGTRCYRRRLEKRLQHCGFDGLLKRYFFSGDSKFLSSFTFLSDEQLLECNGQSIPLDYLNYFLDRMRNSKGVKDYMVKSFIENIKHRYKYELRTSVYFDSDSYSSSSDFDSDF